jgi:glycosyltransferase involved in cell wall biosynthesis
MKILFVAIPNHHFFQWANQLKDSGHEVFWFDITDGAGFVERINWITQFNGWKIKWNYPFRYKIKKNSPRIYSILEKCTTNKVEDVFKKLVSEIKPDLIHCFEIQLAGLPILSVMQKNAIPFIYSSWGSDIFFYENYNVTKNSVLQFLKRVDFVITDCIRDKNIIQKLGIKLTPIAVFPGNGGISVDNSFIHEITTRNTIVFKGYQMDVGEAIGILKAIESLDVYKINKYDFVVYSADEEIVDYIKKSQFLKQLNFIIYKRKKIIPNSELLKIFGKSLIHIGNNVSDGMPNSLLEAMAMGAFPIQSNPGNVTEEVIKHGQNGFLIENPHDSVEIANHLKNALKDLKLIEKAMKSNINLIKENYNREILKDKIVSLYSSILNKN